MKSDHPYQKTTMPNLLEKLQAQYGKMAGEAIFADACAMLSEKLATIDAGTDRAIARHLSMGILPSGACYLALLNHNIPRDEALRFVTEQIANYTEKTGRQMKRLCGWMPFPIFHMAVKAMIASGYPSSGWKIVWGKSTSISIAFDMKSCLYLDVFRKMGCPELCAAYCDADHVMFSALAPKVVFSRTGTLANDCTCCDFTFLKG